MKIGYLNEIHGFENIYEILCETFGNVIQMLNSETIIFGGALRDVIAGMEIEGDLDVITSTSGYEKIRDVIESDVRWSISPSKGIMDYKEAGAVEVKEYISYDNKRVQFIIPNDSGIFSRIMDNYSTNTISKLIDSVRDVDIVCCGFVMLENGKVFEVLPEAYDDCKNKILRLNTSSKKIGIDRLKNRVSKLVQRGWISKIDMRTVILLSKKDSPSVFKTKIEKAIKEFNKRSTCEGVAYKIKNEMSILEIIGSESALELFLISEPLKKLLRDKVILDTHTTLRMKVPFSQDQIRYSPRRNEFFLAYHIPN